MSKIVTRWYVWILRTFVSMYRLQTLTVAEKGLRWLGAAVIPVRIFGFQMRLRVNRSNAHRLLLVEGERFLTESRLLESLLHPNDTVIDVGANIGYYMLLFQKIVGPQGHIICVEPEPDNAAELKALIECNSFENVELIEAAAGRVTGRTGLDSGLNGVVAIDAVGDVTVDMIILDAFADRQPDFVKIDIEGYEAHALAGAERLLRECKPTLFLEIHPWMLRDASVPEIFQLLKSIYTSVIFCGERQSSSRFDRFRKRYGLISGIIQFDEAHALQIQNRPFWIVCPTDQRHSAIEFS